MCALPAGPKQLKGDIKEKKEERDRRSPKPSAKNKSPFRERVVKIKGKTSKIERDLSDWLWSLWGDHK